jgi:capsular polysaccharide export protein
VALQRRMRERFPAQMVAIGFSRWKKPIARAFFAGSDCASRTRGARADGPRAWRCGAGAGARRSR